MLDERATPVSLWERLYTNIGHVFKSIVAVGVSTAVACKEALLASAWQATVMSAWKILG